MDDLIREYVDHWNLNPQNATVYLCGHPTMIENGKGILQRRGWRKEGIKEEVYFIPGKQPPVNKDKRTWPWSRQGSKRVDAA